MSDMTEELNWKQEVNHSELIISFFHFHIIYNIENNVCVYLAI